jgi:Mn-dependent DtxR family transcriptional regulator
MANNQKHDPSEFLEFIIGFKKAANGNSPTFRDISLRFDCSTSVVDFVLKKLEREGEIKRTKHGIEVIGSSWKMNV